MDNKKFIQLLRAVIREEVKTAVKQVLAEQKQPQSKPAHISSLKEAYDDPFEKANRILQQSRGEQPIQNRKLSKNPILNEVLNQTMPFQPGMSRDDGEYGTMNLTADMIGYGGMMNNGLPTENPDGQPLNINPANKEVAAVAKAMTRDYSELVKKFKK